MERKRDRLEIVYDILTFLMRGVNGQTRLMYKANLSYAQLQEYLGTLEKQGMIEIISKGKNKKLHLTENGSKYAEKIRAVLEFEKAFRIE